MDQDKLRIESIGYIFKVEDLSVVDYNILPNTLVMESHEPFPGYHGKNLPNIEKPRNIYLFVRDWYGFEDIARISRDLKAVFPHSFNATPAEIRLNNKLYPALRIKFLESFEQLPELQGCFCDAGIRFRKNKKIAGSARIKVHRYFLVELAAPGIYRDLTEPEQCYIEIPRVLSWKNFELITRNVKNNVENRNFDAALGMMYRFGGPVELVRIWDRDKTLERTMELREKYLEFIRKSDL